MNGERMRDEARDPELLFAGALYHEQATRCDSRRQKINHTGSSKRHHFDPAFRRRRNECDAFRLIDGQAAMTMLRPSVDLAIGERLAVDETDRGIETTRDQNASARGRKLIGKAARPHPSDDARA